MRRYFDTVKTLLKIANGKFFVVIQMFVSCCLYNLSNLLPPIATAGIIAAITNNNFNGIWYYVLLYLVFYTIYFSMLNWNYYTYTVLANYYHLEVQKMLFEHVANNDSIFNKISKGKIVDTTSDDVRYLVDVLNAASEALMRFLQLIVIFIIFRSSTNGSASPKLFPYDNHHRKSTLDASSPNKPPTTKPAKININNTHIFLSLVATLLLLFLTEINN